VIVEGPVADDMDDDWSTAEEGSTTGGVDGEMREVSKAGGRDFKVGTVALKT
jgi:hypothetical protein